MTLTTVPRYDPAHDPNPTGHAVVIGGSMAGLMAARALADWFERVTVIERDPLIDEPTTRPGVPQDRHVHVLHEAGRATLEDFFPGFCAELADAGAETVDIASEIDLYDEGGFLANPPKPIPMYCASRPLFEQTLRRRVGELEGVDVRVGSLVTDLLVDADPAAAVEGVAVRDPGVEAEEIPADLVLDAAGRTSRTPRWLENHGYRRPRVEQVNVDVGYSTVHVERPPEDRRAFVVMPSPQHTRGGIVLPIEDGRWVMTLQGVNGDAPPTDLEGFEAYAASLPIPDFVELLDGHPLRSTEVDHYPFSSSLRNRYGDLERFPEGLCVIGDAIASFNPLYGQGMSVAALEAVQLHHTLAAGGRADLALRFFDRVSRLVDDAWKLSVGADFQFSGTTGPKPRGTDLFNRYVARLTQKAHTDGTLADAFARVITMERPPQSLLSPGVVWRVLNPIS